MMGDISVAIFLWGEFFFATCFRQIIFFCAKNIFSSHLATMAIGSANPAYPTHHIIKEEMLLVFWILELGVELQPTLFLEKQLKQAV